MKPFFSLSQAIKVYIISVTLFIFGCFIYALISSSSNNQNDQQKLSNGEMQIITGKKSSEGEQMGMNLLGPKSIKHEIDDDQVHGSEGESELDMDTDIVENINGIIESEDIEPPTDNAVIIKLIPTESDDMNFYENLEELYEQDVIQEDQDYGYSSNFNGEVDLVVLNQDLDSDEDEEKEKEEEEAKEANENNENRSEASIINFENNEIFTDVSSEHEEEEEETIDDISRINNDNDEILDLEEIIHETNGIPAVSVATVVISSNQELFQLNESN